MTYHVKIRDSSEVTEQGPFGGMTLPGCFVGVACDTDGCETSGVVHEDRLTEARNNGEEIRAWCPECYEHSNRS